MSSFLDEEVPPVRPLSIGAIEELARVVLAQLAPEMLLAPRALDVLHLVDQELPRHGIHVLPASREELGDRHGATDPSGADDDDVDILVDEDTWAQLEAGGPGAYHARTTVCHEIGHALLHVPILRRRLLLTNGLARVRRGALKAYEDPEWQAWTFTGAILMPRTTIAMVAGSDVALTPETLSTTYEVSVKMARARLKQIRAAV